MYIYIFFVKGPAHFEILSLTAKDLQEKSTKDIDIVRDPKRKGQARGGATGPTAGCTVQTSGLP